MIATADNGEIIILDGDNSSDLSPNNNNYNGWNTDQILEEIMGVESLENKIYESLIREGMEYIRHKDIDKLKTLIHKLQNVAHPSDTIISVFNIKLAELQLEV